MAKKNNGEKPQNLNETVARLKILSEEMETVRKQVENLGDEDLQSETLDTIDKINSIKYEITARLDGRPQPLDFSQGRETNSSGERNTPLKKWAECFERGHEDVGNVGGIHVSLKDLKQISAWISQTIEWHSKHPAPKKSAPRISPPPKHI